MIRQWVRGFFEAFITGILVVLGAMVCIYFIAMVGLSLIFAFGVHWTLGILCALFWIAVVCATESVL